MVSGTTGAHNIVVAASFAMSKPLLFTEKLRASSSSLHAVSDALVVAKLMVAFTDKRVYGLALGSFYHVYLAIEQLLYKCRQTDGG